MNDKVLIFTFFLFLSFPAYAHDFGWVPGAVGMLASSFILTIYLSGGGNRLVCVLTLIIIWGLMFGMLFLGWNVFLFGLFLIFIQPIISNLYKNYLIRNANS